MKAKEYFQSEIKRLGAQARAIVHLAEDQAREMTEEEEQQVDALIKNIAGYKKKLQEMEEPGRVLVTISCTQHEDGSWCCTTSERKL